MRLILRLSWRRYDDDDTRNDCKQSVVVPFHRSAYGFLQRHWCVLCNRTHIHSDISTHELLDIWKCDLMMVNGIFSVDGDTMKGMFSSGHIVKLSGIHRLKNPDANAEKPLENKVLGDAAAAAVVRIIEKPKHCKKQIGGFWARLIWTNVPIRMRQDEASAKESFKSKHYKVCFIRLEKEFDHSFACELKQYRKWIEDDELVEWNYAGSIFWRKMSVLFGEEAKEWNKLEFLEDGV